MLKPSSKIVIALAILFILTLGAYAKIHTFKFTNYDDNNYLVQNPYIANGVNARAIQWAFAFPTLSRNIDHSPFWRPATYLTHMIDVELYGLNPGGHHLTNLIFHILNVMLLFLILNRLTGNLGLSLIAGCLFAVHPLQVESVAWVSARNVLVSMCFGLLAIFAYTVFANTGKKLAYVASVLCYFFCLLSKTTLVGLPLLLLLLDYWPLKRATLETVDRNKWFRLVLEKWPFFLLAFAAACMAMLTQPEALKVALNLAPANRPINSLCSYGFYALKTFFPIGLTPYYPNWTYPIQEISNWLVALSGLFLMIGCILSIAVAKRFPYIFVGWFWYVIALLPASVLPEPADRYAYEPMVGLIIITVWTAAGLVLENKKLHRTACAFAGAVIVLFAILTHIQANYWQDSFKLFNRALSLNPGNDVVHVNLGNALGGEGKLDEAANHFLAAIEINPKNSAAYENLGNALLLKNDMQGAAQAFARTAVLDPGNWNALRMLGWFAAMQGNQDQALALFQQSLAIKNDAPQTHADLAMLYLKMGKTDEAIYHFGQSLNYKNDNDDVRQKLALLLEQKKQAAQMPEAGARP
jgi:tetratricopeptide (TPR) repeat protein